MKIFYSLQVANDSDGSTLLFYFGFWFFVLETRVLVVGNKERYGVEWRIRKRAVLQPLVLLTVIGWMPW